MANKIDIPNGWDVKKLGEVFKKINIKNKDKLITQVLTNSAQYGVIAQEEFFDKSIATKENINTYYILNIDDFIYNPRISKFAPAGPISRNKYKIGCVSPLYTVFKMTANYNIDFYELYFKSNIWNRQAYNIANFGARFDRMNITDTDFFNMPIPIPPLAEQEKIAEILSLWDKAIEQTKELIAYKEKQKKGLMQNLLTGKKRLHGFNDKWKTVKLGEVFDIQMCRRIYKDQTNSIGGIPFYKIGTMGKIADAFIDEQLFNTYKNKYNYPLNGETLITCSGTIGKCYQYNGEKAYYQDSNIVWLRTKNKYKINLNYIFIVVSNIKWNSVEKTTITRLYTPTLKKAEIFLPPLDEQKAIADILCKADEEIELLNKQLDLYTEQKKGLMQNLLTGKVRVTV